MASVKIKNKALRVVSNNCKEINIIDDIDNNALIKIIDTNGNKKTIKILKNKPIMIKVNGMVKFADVNNTLIIIGDVTKCNVGHILSVEGFIRDGFDNNVIVDKTIKVCYGKERCIRSGLKYSKTIKTIEIDGDLDTLKVGITGVSLESVIIGNVDNAIVGKSLGIKGILHSYNEDIQSIYTTSGESTAPSLKDIIKQSKEREASLGNLLNDIFSTLTFYN